MIVYPNAKINLGLHIVNKRPDGYHNLETIFYPLDVKDKIEIEESSEFSFNKFTTSSSTYSSDTNNRFKFL